MEGLLEFILPHCSGWSLFWEALNTPLPRAVKEPAPTTGERHLFLRALLTSAFLEPSTTSHPCCILIPSTTIRPTSCNHLLQMRPPPSLPPLQFLSPPPRAPGRSPSQGHRCALST